MKQQPQTDLTPALIFTVFDPLDECLYCCGSFNMAAAAADKLGGTLIIEMRAADLMNPSAVLTLHHKQDYGQWQTDTPPRPATEPRLALP